MSRATLAGRRCPVRNSYAPAFFFAPVVLALALIISSCRESGGDECEPGERQEYCCWVADGNTLCAITDEWIEWDDPECRRLVCEGDICHTEQCEEREEPYPIASVWHMEGTLDEALGEWERAPCYEHNDGLDERCGG